MQSNAMHRGQAGQQGSHGHQGPGPGTFALHRSITMGHNRRLKLVSVGLTVPGVLKKIKARKRARRRRNPLAAYGLITREGRLLHGKAGNYKLVANFVIHEIRSTTQSYYDGCDVPLHHIHGRSGSDEMALKLTGSIYEAPAYATASNGRLVVNSPVQFRTYLNHLVQQERIQRDDPAAREVLGVGTFLNHQGQLQPSDGVQFPGKAEECVYHAHRFADTGRKGTFHAIAGLFNDGSVRFLLTYALGTILKPALGWAYPHMAVEGDSGVGKSTVMDLLKDAFGWLCVGGPTEFRTPYRIKKVLANSVLPIQVDEFNRVSNRRQVVDALNEAYNCQPSTHGQHSRHYCICAPAILYGQDVAIDDIALRGKLVRVELQKPARNESALSAYRANRTKWPMREWVDFACDWANAKNLDQLVWRKQRAFEGKVDQHALQHVSNIGRIVQNYAMVAVAGDALRAFGVNAATDDGVLARLQAHLQRLLGDQGGDDRSTIARQFITDVARRIQTSSASGFLWTVKAEGLFVHVDRALKAVGGHYGVRDPRRIRKMIAAESLGTNSHTVRIRGNQVRCTLIPKEVLDQLGLDLQAQEDTA